MTQETTHTPDGFRLYHESTIQLLQARYYFSKHVEFLQEGMGAFEAFNALEDMFHDAFHYHRYQSFESFCNARNYYKYRGFDNKREN